MKVSELANQFATHILFSIIISVSIGSTATEVITTTTSYSSQETTATAITNVTTNLTIPTIVPISTINYLHQVFVYINEYIYIIMTCLHYLTLYTPCLINSEQSPSECSGTKSPPMHGSVYNCPPTQLIGLMCASVMMIPWTENELRYILQLNVTCSRLMMLQLTVMKLKMFSA